MSSSLFCPSLGIFRDSTITLSSLFGYVSAVTEADAEACSPSQIQLLALIAALQIKMG